MIDKTKKLSLAICGLGRFATRRILPAIAECNDVELVAVVDRSGKAEGLPAGTRRFASLEEFLATNPDGAVYISSPNYLHAQQSLQCLAAGLHVLCEKPMATNSVDCQSMVQAARNLNLQLQVGHMLRYSPALQLARQWVQNGVLGKVCSIRAIFHYDLPEINRPWAFRKDLAGGGVLMDAGVHCIDVIRFLIGGPTVSLTAKTGSHFQVDGIERSADCHFTAGGGVSCLVDLCSQASYSTILTISGSESRIVIDNFAACWGEIAVKLYACQSGQLVEEKVVDVSTIYSKQIQHFAEVLTRPAFVASQDLDAAENVKIVEDLYAISQRS